MLGVLSAFENRFVYFPTRADQDWYEPTTLSKQDVSLALADGATIHAWWCPKPGADTALIYAHGNGGNLSHRTPWYEMMQQKLRVSILAFDYPGYGKSTGSPSEAGCYASAEAAWQWLTTTGGISPDRIVLFGESLGGGVVTEIATRHPCRALALYSTFSTMPAVAKELYPILPTESLMRNRYDNLTKIATLRCPVFIAHGAADRMIAPHHGQRLFDAAHEPKTLFWIPGADHNDAMRPEMVEALGEFLRRTRPL